jgi:hypothetical protein
LNEENGTVGLNADITSALELRNRALAFLLQLLQLRLEERELYDPIHPHAFVAAIEAGPLTDRVLEEVTPAITWLYRPAEEESEAAAPVLPATVPDIQLEPVASTNSEVFTPLPGPDSGVVEVGIELVVTETRLVLAPTSDHAKPPEPANAAPEPTWDPYAFDGALPDADPPTEANYNTPPDASQQPEAAQETNPAAESTTAMFGVVDVAVITSEAVAAAAAESPSPPVPEPEPEPFAFAPPVTSPAPSANGTHPEAADILTAVPVGDWLPDGDPLFPEVALPSVASPAPPAETALPVAKIAPPPLPTAIQPPYPPLPPPPESA